MYGVRWLILLCDGVVPSMHRNIAKLKICLGSSSVKHIMLIISLKVVLRDAIKDYPWCSSGTFTAAPSVGRAEMDVCSPETRFQALWLWQFP